MLRHYLPKSLRTVLWGDRDRFGQTPVADDPEWRRWHDVCYAEYYADTQHQGIGDRVCRAGYSVLERLAFGGTSVLEIGPGIIRHLDYLDEVPACYTIVDIKQEFLSMAESQLRERHYPHELALLTPDGRLPFADNAFDRLITFYSLEHLHPLARYLTEIQRVLKPDAMLVGAIPCEGGLAWGLGRYLTSRRHVMRNYGINYDKVICWDHPNFADRIYRELDQRFSRVHRSLFPFPLMPLDVNLVGRFIYRNS